MNPARTLGAAFAFWDFSHFFVYLFATLGRCHAQVEPTNSPSHDSLIGRHESHRIHVQSSQPSLADSTRARTHAHTHTHARTHSLTHTHTHTHTRHQTYWIIRFDGKVDFFKLRSVNIMWSWPELHSLDVLLVHLHVYLLSCHATNFLLMLTAA
jgi:hypothetical protein